MIVRFDSAALRHTVEHRIEPIGVEGDPLTHRGGLSEAEAIVLEAKQKFRYLAHRHLDVTKTAEEEREKETGQMDSIVASSSSTSNDTDVNIGTAATSATSDDSEEINQGEVQPRMNSKKGR